MSDLFSLENAEKICDNYILPSGSWEGITGVLCKLSCQGIPLLFIASPGVSGLYYVYFYSVDTWLLDYMRIGKSYRQNVCV